MTCQCPPPPQLLASSRLSCAAVWLRLVKLSWVGDVSSVTSTWSLWPRSSGSLILTAPPRTTRISCCFCKKVSMSCYDCWQPEMYSQVTLWPPPPSLCPCISMSRRASQHMDANKAEPWMRTRRREGSHRPGSCRSRPGREQIQERSKPSPVFVAPRLDANKSRRGHPPPVLSLYA